MEVHLPRELLRHGRLGHFSEDPIERLHHTDRIHREIFKNEKSMLKQRQLIAKRVEISKTPAVQRQIERITDLTKRAFAPTTVARKKIKSDEKVNVKRETYEATYNAMPADAKTMSPTLCAPCVGTPYVRTPHLNNTLTQVHTEAKSSVVVDFSTCNFGDNITFTSEESIATASNANARPNKTKEAKEDSCYNCDIKYKESDKCWYGCSTCLTLWVCAKADCKRFLDVHESSHL